MTTYGLEIEMSDINLNKAAELVFNTQGMLFSEWKDRGNSTRSKVRRYDIWNITSDKTIENHNGTQCRKKVMLPTGEIVEGSEENRPYWQGAELVTPVLNFENLPNDFADLNSYLQMLYEAGATIDADMFNDLHVHVDFGEQSEENWKRLLEFTAWVRDAQYPLIKIHEAATNKHSPVRYAYKDKFVDELLACKDYDEYSWTYRQHQPGKDNGHQTFELYQHRRLICPGAVMDPTKGYNTLEWRVWPGTDNILLTLMMTIFSVQSTLEFPSLKFVEGFSEFMIEEFRQDKERKNANREA